MTNTNNTNTAKQNDWKEREIGCLWTRVAATSGKKYLSGTLVFKSDVKAGQQIAVVGYSNSQKKADNQPDFNFYISEQKNGNKPAKPTVAPVAKPATPVAQASDDSSELL
jgi:uncharacterized protein (DUF736 family)